MIWFRRIALFLFAFYVGGVALIYFAQRTFLYFPPDLYLTPTAVGLSGLDEVEVSLDDDTKLTAWWGQPTSSDGAIVMVFHGNGSAVYSNTDIFADLMAAGHGMWSVAYPGYPGSEGTPSQEALVTAAVAQYDALQMRNILDRPVVFYGTSLGSGVAAQVAAQRRPAKIFVDAPFNSTLDMGRAQMPFLPIRMLIKDTYRSDDALSELNVPLYWTHGTSDRIIPVSQGQKLFDGYAGPKDSLVIEGGQHTNLWGLGGREFTLGNL